MTQNKKSLVSSYSLRIDEKTFSSFVTRTRKRNNVRTRNERRKTDAIAVLAIMLIAAVLSSCGIYTFSGASIPAHVTSISIPLLEDQTRSGQPSLAEDLTDQLLDQFVQRTRLVLASDEESADLLLLGNIQRYRNEPTSVTGDESAALSRVSLQVQIVYLDQTNDSETLNRSFSSSATYDPVEDGLDGEDLAIAEAIETLAGDIFTAATSDW